MLKSLRFQFKVRKNKLSQPWQESSVEDEEDDDEDFHVVEHHDEQVDSPGVDSGTWSVPHLLGLDEINLNLMCELKLSEESKLLTFSQIQQLSQHLPEVLSLCEWMLIYQTQTHGSSLRTLYRATEELDRCMVLIVRDTYGQVFGVVCSAPLRVSSSYYGTGQTFLFSFSPHLQVYKWTEVNSYFIKGGMDALLFGGGRGRFGLWINGDLIRGRSQKCDTFDNEILSSEEDFVINEMEVWALV